MTRLTTILFFTVVVAQVAGLLAFTGVREAALARGREVVLQTVPVDPRSLLQGDYAILDYEIARLPGHLADTPVGEVVGQVVYVGLREHRDVWYANGYFFTRCLPGSIFTFGASSTGPIIWTLASVLSLSRKGRAVLSNERMTSRLWRYWTGTVGP